MNAHRILFLARLHCGHPPMKFKRQVRNSELWEGWRPGIQNPEDTSPLSMFIWIKVRHTAQACYRPTGDRRDIRAKS